MSPKLLRPLAAVAVVAAAGVAWWQLSAPEAPAVAASSVPPATNPAAAEASAIALRNNSHALDPLLTPDLLRIFEQMLNDSQARDKEGLMAEMRAKIDKHLPPEWRVRGLGLLERYIDYRNALEALPAASIGDPAGLRRILDARAGIRARYFAPEEVEGLFGAEEKFDRFSVEKLEIERNKDLTPEQKREALAQTEKNWLTPEQTGRPGCHHGATRRRRADRGAGSTRCEPPGALCRALPAVRPRGSAAAGHARPAGARLAKPPLALCRSRRGHAGAVAGPALHAAGGAAASGRAGSPRRQRQEEGALYAVTTVLFAAAEAGRPNTRSKAQLKTKV